MNTFLEFYIALLKFVNFKLFTDLGMSQIPTAVGEDQLYLDVHEVRRLQKVARKKFEDGALSGNDKYQISEEFKETPEMKKLSKKEETIKKQRSVF